MSDDYKLIVGSLPDRKSKALSVQKGCVIWPVAYFRDEESYQRFLCRCSGWLADRVGGGRMTRYRTIVADPPWDVQRLESPGRAGFGTQAGTLRSVRLEYPTMSLQDITALPVEALAEDDAHLYIWTINRYVEATYDIARAWGFEPGALLTWCKAPMGLGPGGAYSQTSEHILFARRGRDVRLRRWDTTWWQWPRGRHSAKPDALQDIVEQVSPGPYLELFARRDRLGWDTWGNESLGTAEVAA